MLKQTLNLTLTLTLPLTPNTHLTLPLTLALTLALTPTLTLPQTEARGGGIADGVVHAERCRSRRCGRRSLAANPPRTKFVAHAGMYMRVCACGCMASAHT